METRKQFRLCHLGSTGQFGWMKAVVIGLGFLGLGPMIASGQLAAGLDRFVGCSIASHIPSNFAKYWNQVTPGNAGKWGSVEYTQDSYNWTPLDNIYNYALANGFPYKHHTLVWGSQYPTWITSLDSADQRAQVEEWIQLVADRYPQASFVDVVNESFTTPVPFMNALGGTGATGWDWVVTVFQWARLYFPPEVKLILNEYNVLQSNSVTDNFIRLVDTLKVRGLIDAIGIQGHSFEFYGSGYSYPVATLESNLNRLAAATGLPIYISEFDINDADNAVQLQHYQTYFPLFWENPAVKGITLWGYIDDGEMWRGDAWLVTTKGGERPAMKWLKTYLVSPFAPKLISPNGKSNVVRNPVLLWNASDSAASYHIQLATSITFSTNVLDTTVADTLLQLNPLDAKKRYYWHVNASNEHGTSLYSSTATFMTGDQTSDVESIAKGPNGFHLFQNFPNPFNPTTTIAFSLPERSHVRLSLINLLGKEVMTVASGQFEPGVHSMPLNAEHLSSGVYFYKLEAGDFVALGKMMLIK